MIEENGTLDVVRGVRWLASLLKARVEDDPSLRSISIRGEVTNYKPQSKGHLNFDLSEEGFVLRCFAWADDFNLFPPFANGAKVVAKGQVTVYAQRGHYELVVRNVRLEGVGGVHEQFEARKKQLAAEGLFDPARKRRLPRFPFRVALVSSRRAEGARDFQTRLATLRPHVGIVFCETSVQGPNAAYEIAGAIGYASKLDVDAIVVTRGGGSFEDLFVFSDERVVRAIAGAAHPVLSAIGHTVDQQLSDFAADLHAETPSAAAERIGYATDTLLDGLHTRGFALKRSAEARVLTAATGLERATLRSKLGDGRLLLLPARQGLDAADEGLNAGAAIRL
ncbi:MAG: exodeoxyribonuclease VII large subunit, partial [Candidatus Eremiobacteraeota bacterium]|nr:exodeoxyribonuclease VII large subunit [Candidatus Eremiobacteraeota bacterium]